MCELNCIKQNFVQTTDQYLLGKFVFCAKCIFTGRFFFLLMEYFGCSINFSISIVEFQKIRQGLPFLVWDFLPFPLFLLRTRKKVEQRKDMDFLKSHLRLGVEKEKLWCYFLYCIGSLALLEPHIYKSKATAIQNKHFFFFLPYSSSNHLLSTSYMSDTRLVAFFSFFSCIHGI